MLASIGELYVQDYIGRDHGCTMDIAVSGRSNRINIIAQNFILRLYFCNYE
jgi:hypothetical protein